MATREWVRFNEASGAKRNRERYVAAHGGEFVKGRKGWEWRGTVPAPAPVKKTVQTTTPKKKKIKLRGDSK